MTPLQQVHEGLGARFAGQDGRGLPHDYGDVRGEYEAIRSGMAVIDLSPAGHQPMLRSFPTTIVTSASPVGWVPR